jgi:ketosteroid isomerase-like protein
MTKTLSVLALTFGPAFAAEDAKTSDKWIEAYYKNDAAALTALYTADAVLLPQGSAQPIANNIRKFMDEMIKQKLGNIVLPVA